MVMHSDGDVNDADLMILAEPKWNLSWALPSAKMIWIRPAKTQANFLQNGFGTELESKTA